MHTSFVMLSRIATGDAQLEPKTHCCLLPKRLMNIQYVDEIIDSCLMGTTAAWMLALVSLVSVQSNSKGTRTDGAATRSSPVRPRWKDYCILLDLRVLFGRANNKVHARMVAATLRPLEGVAVATEREQMPRGDPPLHTKALLTATLSKLLTHPLHRFRSPASSLKSIVAAHRETDRGYACSSDRDTSRGCPRGHRSRKYIARSVDQFGNVPVPLLVKLCLQSD